MIATHCHSTLDNFVLADANTNLKPAPKKPSTDLGNLKYLSQLKSLEVKRSNLTDFSWLMQVYPKLETARFYFLTQMMDNQLLDFLRLNP